MPRTGVSRTSVQTLGLAAAGVLFALAAALIAWSVLTTRNPATPARAAAPESIIAPAEAPDVVDLASAGRGGLDDALHRGGGVYIRLEDPDTGRVTSEMTADRLDPAGASVYDVKRPAAWLYMADGQTVHVRADEGRVLMPDRQAGPESGDFRGDVRIRVYDPKPGDAPIDLVADIPSAEVRTPALRFDLTFGEITTPDDDGPTPVEVETPELTFAGRGLRLLVSEVRERVELLEIHEGEYLRYTPAPPSEPAPGDGSAETTLAEADDAPVEAPIGPPAPEGESKPAATAEASQDGAPAPARPAETLYYITFDKAVAVRGDGRRIAGDRLELWVRLLDNALPAGAIAGFDGTNAEDADAERNAAAVIETAGPEAPDAVTTNEPDAPAVVAAKPPADTGPHAESGPFGLLVPPAKGSPVFGLIVSNQPRSVDDPAPGDPPEVVAQAPTPSEPPETAPKIQAEGGALVELIWKGPLRVKPIDNSTPAELSAGNHLAARFTAPESGLVRFEDAAAGRGTAAAAGYFATTQDLLLEGVGPVGVELETDRGRVACSRLEMNLASGVVHTPGAGAMEAATRGSITWREQADFVFATENGRMTEALRVAVLQGDVRATDGRARLSAGAMRAVFRADETVASRIHSLFAMEGVVGEDGRGGALTSDRLTVMFDPGTRGAAADPAIVTADGRVFANKDSTSIACDSLEARLTRGERGDSEITDVLATGEPVQFDRLDDDLSVVTRQIIANAPRQQVELQGSGSRITRGDVRIDGDQIALDGLARTVHVFGPGAFAVDTQADGAPAALEATWQSEMRFNDRVGLIEAYGLVEAEARAWGPASVMASDLGLTRRDHIEAERLRIELAPAIESIADAGDDASGAFANADAPGGDRPVLRAEAWGAVDDFPGGLPARFEARRYAASPAGPEAIDQSLERLLYLSANHIIADNAEGTLTTPVAGEMLLFDRAPLAEGVAPGGDEDRRGRALFRWAGDMRVDRAAGRAEMRERVVLNHRRETDDSTTEVEAEAMEASFDTTDGGGGRLTAATARGAAYVRTGLRELVAELLRYDATAQIVDASSEDADVTLLDGATGRTIRARRLLWDMVRDRVQIREPAGARGPR